MTLPVASNPVSFSAIQTEYGGSNPIKLSEYYRNASPDLVINNATNASLPDTGAAIRVGQFHGTTQGPDVEVTTGTTVYHTDGFRETFVETDNPEVQANTAFTVAISASTITLDIDGLLESGGIGSTTDNSTNGGAAVNAYTATSVGSNFVRWKVVVTSSVGPVENVTGSGTATTATGGTISDNTWYDIAAGTKTSWVRALSKCTDSAGGDVDASYSFTLDFYYDTDLVGSGTLIGSFTVSANTRAKDFFEG